MKDDVIWIAVAETSVIVRSGILSVLKHMPETAHAFQLMEITSMASLQSCMQTHVPNVLIVNPTFGGWFNIEEFKAEGQNTGVKCVALVCNITDHNLLKRYDESINLFDNEETVYQKINNLFHKPEDDTDIDTNSLSQREKEIITCVVKGMTNKEIAEQLYISIHTVITHRRNIARKLQIHSPSGLTIYAIVNKLVELSDVKM